MYSYMIMIVFKYLWEKRYFFRKERIKLIVLLKKIFKINVIFLKCMQRNKEFGGLFYRGDVIFVVVKIDVIC